MHNAPYKISSFPKLREGEKKIIIATAEKIKKKKKTREVREIKLWRIANDHIETHCKSKTIQELPQLQQ